MFFFKIHKAFKSTGASCFPLPDESLHEISSHLAN